MTFPASPQYTDWADSTLEGLLQVTTLGPTGPADGATGPTGPTGPAGAVNAVNVQTGTTYTLVAGDNGKTVTLSNASAITLTVAASLGAAFECQIVQLGAGIVTYSPAGGVAVHNAHSYTGTRAQYSVMSLIAYSANNFVSFGDGA